MRLRNPTQRLLAVRDRHAAEPKPKGAQRSSRKQLPAMQSSSSIELLTTQHIAAKRLAAGCFPADQVAKCLVSHNYALYFLIA
jgi:hypothetical protein